MKKRKETLDELDVRLLAVFGEDPTQSYSRIREKLGVSVGTVYLRINRLKELGVIKGSQLILDPKKLGYSFSVFIRFQASDPAAAVKVLEGRLEVSSVHVLTGELNVVVYAYLRNVNELQQLLHYIRSTLNTDRIEVQIVLDSPIQRGVPLPVMEERAPKSRSGRPPSSGRKSSSKKK
ncbi:MAG: Lrp/AsnC family transcriptional regulator [Bacteroidia bacterium]|nr:Lrp/AsnC family transcriptional regulator [Bacteroidia bacterium]